MELWDQHTIHISPTDFYGNISSFSSAQWDNTRKQK